MTRHGLIVLLVVLCMLALGVPYFAPHGWGYWGFGPFGLLVIVLIVILVLGA